MDVNPSKMPVNTSQNTTNKQSSPRAEDAQATALPFQSVFDVQQQPKKPEAAETAQAVTQTQGRHNNAAADKHPAARGADAQQKQATNDTVAQLNFARRLQGENAPAPLDATLLHGTDETEALPLPAAGAAEDDEALLTALKEKLTARDAAATAATDDKTRPADDGKNNVKTAAATDELRRGERFADRLTVAESSDKRTLMVDDKAKPRVDQARFSLSDAQTADPKSLPEDFLPLNKKVSDNTPLSLTTAAADTGADNSKSAFSIKSDAGAVSALSATHSQTGVQSPLLMPAAAQSTAAQTNAPVAQPSMQLTGQLGSELWQQQVSQHMVFFSRQGLQQAQLRLHPEELGSLNIHLKIEDNQAVMHFVSPHSHVRAAMESMMPVLRNALQESGIHLAQGSVGQEYHGDTAGQDSTGGNGSGRGDGLSDAIGGPLSGTDSLSSASVSRVALQEARARGGIDTFA